MQIDGLLLAAMKHAFPSLPFCRVHLNDKYTRFFLFSYEVCPQSATLPCDPSLPLNLVSISYFVS